MPLSQVFAAHDYGIFQLLLVNDGDKTYEYSLRGIEGAGGVGWGAIKRLKPGSGHHRNL